MFRKEGLFNNFPALFLTVLVTSLFFAPMARGEAEQSRKKDEATRNFYEVLEDILADFEYDLKNGSVMGMKDLSIRNIAISENVPASFKSHLELLITERILKNNKTRIIQCLPCRSKKTTLNGDQMVISSPDSNPAELARIAKLTGIANFMDAAFSFQSTGMVLSMYTVDAESGTIVWSRSYNSETSRASAFRRGVDYSQVENARRAMEYEPVVQYRLTAYYFIEPDVADSKSCLGLGYRMMERYDNRHKEVGFEFNYLKSTSSLSGESSSASPAKKSLYSGLNLTLLFVHSWNLIGAEENYNQARGNIFAAIGGTYASGFLGGLIRSGYEWRLAKHWGFSLDLGLRPSSSAFIGSTKAGAVSGVEYGLGIHAMF